MINHFGEKYYLEFWNIFAGSLDEAFSRVICKCEDNLMERLETNSRINTPYLVVASNAIVNELKISKRAVNRYN